MKARKVFLVLVVAAVSLGTLFYWGTLLQALSALEKVSSAAPTLTAAILILLKTVAAPLGLPGTPLTLLTGSLLGSLWGTVVALIGNTAGAALAFLLSRYVFKDYVQMTLLPKYPRIKEYEQRLEREAFLTVVILRLTPLFPFNGLNFLLGVTNISFGAYVLGSFIGMIPGTFAFVYFGESLRMFSLVKVLFAVVGIAGLIYIGHRYEKSRATSSGG